MTNHAPGINVEICRRLTVDARNIRLKCVSEAKPASMATSEMRFLRFASSFLALRAHIERYCVQVTGPLRA